MGGSILRSEWPRSGGCEWPRGVDDGLVPALSLLRLSRCLLGPPGVSSGDEEVVDRIARAHGRRLWHPECSSTAARGLHALAEVDGSRACSEARVTNDGYLRPPPSVERWGALAAK